MKSRQIITGTVILIILTLMVLTLLSYQQVRKEVEPEPISITVSIPPLKYLADRITGGEIAVNVILPPGSGPETYEPGPRSLKELDRSPVIFITGLIDFENTVARRVGKDKTVSVSTGVELLGEVCSHHHIDNHGHRHHGVDPHIWSSPVRLKTMALNMCENIPAAYRKESYGVNLKFLLDDIDSLDSYIRSKFSGGDVKAFMIYHPALTYYADDYNLEQLQLEYDGKEPSADKLRITVERAKTEGIDKILYQKEFSIKTVETVAKDLNAVPVVIDPLDEDVLSNIRNITDIIVGEQ